MTDFVLTTLVVCAASLVSLPVVAAG